MQQQGMDMTTTSTYTSRVRGMLLGGAVGDALGAAIEFSSLAAIRRLYGPEGITDYAHAYGGRGRWTDDTQMTLFTAEGLLDARAAGARDSSGIVEHIWAAYRRWYGTQTGNGPGGSGLAAIPSMHHRRAPGATCVAALSGSQPGTVDRAINDSKGCGGVMRVAPIGMLDDAYAVANAAAALTHGHPSGWLAAGALAVMVRRLLHGYDQSTAVAAGLAAVREDAEAIEVVEALEAAVAIAGSGAPRSAETVERLGEGWVAEETLAIAVYAFLVADDFDTAVRLGANHSGDSDSTASISGQLYGAYAGDDAIAERWLADLELRAEITELADRMTTAFPVPPD
jgi:ADP-ribosylglycohydrolase